MRSKPCTIQNYTRNTISIMSLHEDLQSLGLDEGDLACDPAMTMCCLQDLRNQRKADALRHKLTAADISQTSIHMRATALHGGLQHGEEGNGGSDESSDFGSSEDEAGDGNEKNGELADIRMRRMQELKQQARQEKDLQAQGYGQLNEVSEGKLLVRHGDMWIPSYILINCGTWDDGSLWVQGRPLPSRFPSRPLHPSPPLRPLHLTHSFSSPWRAT